MILLHGLFQMAHRDRVNRRETKSPRWIHRDRYDRDGYKDPYSRPVPDQQRYDRDGYQDSYGRPVPDQQRYDRDGYKDPYSRPVSDQHRYDRDGYKDPYVRSVPDQQRYERDRYKNLEDVLAKEGTYSAICEAYSMSERSILSSKEIALRTNRIYYSGDAVDLTGEGKT